TTYEKLEQRIEKLEKESYARKLVEEALRESEKKYRTILETIEEGYYEIDLAGNFTFFNEPMRQIMGYPHDELLGMNNRTYATPETAKKMYRIFNNVYTTGRPAKILDYEIIAKDGTIKVMELSVSLRRDRAGEPIGFRGVARDMTERKLAEEALRESESKFKTLFDLCPQPITVTEVSSGRFLDINHRFCEIFGYEREEILGLTSTETGLYSLESREGFVHELKTSGEVKGLEMDFMVKDGSILHTLMFARLILISAEPFILTMIFDITDQKRLEAQFQHAQKMEAVGTLASGISHDFNNILQAISGYIQLLLGKGNQDQENMQYLSAMDLAAGRASDLVQRLLTFSRKVKPELKPMDLTQAVEHTVTMLKRTIPRMISIEMKLADGLKLINGDSSQLEQAIMNLGTNARDAMPEGGELVIETRNVILDETYCRDYLDVDPGEYVSLKVSDTGRGMDEETVKHIFEPFFTTKGVGKGTGLGLSSVYGIVKGHAGHMTCRSEPGQGTVFDIYFPAMQLKKVLGGLSDEGLVDVVAGGDETILLVDDEKAILEIARDILESHGYSTILAGSGEQALDIYREEGARIDLVVLDLGMPGMGGRKCLKRLIEINPGVRAIIASGYFADGQENEILAYGAKGFIGKPYRLEYLLQKVRQVLDE
ncbi:MAG: PAS domain S-box protein, partial [Thermodesulfobacteriota bacterium]|nr:PAS domain S-box protein [Thermodesulfobacteriota bacterium]